jgi:hypothetical protein
MTGRMPPPPSASLGKVHFLAFPSEHDNTASFSLIVSSKNIIDITFLIISNHF